MIYEQARLFTLEERCLILERDFNLHRASMVASRIKPCHHPSLLDSVTQRLFATIINPYGNQLELFLTEPGCNPL